MKKILILSFSVIRSDPRVMRQIRLLENDGRYKVSVAGFGQSPEANIEFFELFRPSSTFLDKVFWSVKLLVGAFASYGNSLAYVQQCRDIFSKIQFDLVIANDISSLPLGIALAKGSPVLLDAHEYSPREFDDRLLWRISFGRYYHYVCTKYLSSVSSMVTVCQGIADEYLRIYGVKAGVVYNAPEDQLLTPIVSKDETIRLIHHGAAIRSRHLEVMIEMMSYLDDRFVLDFMLVETDPKYMSQLRALCEGSEKIKFIRPVATHEICQRLNHYDLGVYLLPPVNFNHEHALPNKFFEFIQARLALAIGPSPEMSKLLKFYGCGVVADSFEPKSLARAIEKISREDIFVYKQAAHRAAADLNYNVGGRLLVSEIERVTSI